MVLACLLVLIPSLAAFAQQAPKVLFNVGANAQIAVTYVFRGYAKQKKGDPNEAIKLDPKGVGAYLGLSPARGPCSCKRTFEVAA
jgi:hypothetical protein